MYNFKHIALCHFPVSREDVVADVLLTEEVDVVVVVEEAETADVLATAELELTSNAVVVVVVVAVVLSAVEEVSSEGNAGTVVVDVVAVVDVIVVVDVDAAAELRAVVLVAVDVDAGALAVPDTLAVDLAVVDETEAPISIGKTENTLTGKNPGKEGLK